MGQSLGDANESVLRVESDVLLVDSLAQPASASGEGWTVSGLAECRWQRSRRAQVYLLKSNSPAFGPRGTAAAAHAKTLPPDVAARSVGGRVDAQQQSMGVQRFKI
jgi:hypothetical protein